MQHTFCGQSSVTNAGRRQRRASQPTTCFTMMVAKMYNKCSHSANDDTWRILPNPASTSQDEPPRCGLHDPTLRRLNPATFYECSNNNFNGNGNQMNGPVHFYVDKVEVAIHQGRFPVRWRRLRTKRRRLVRRRVKSVLVPRPLGPMPSLRRHDRPSI